MNKQTLRLSISLIGAGAFALAGAAHASSSPYAVASRMCQMINNGVSRQQAWKYVVDEYASGSMQNWSQTWGAPRGGLGYGIGYGIAHGIRMGMELRNMRNEVSNLVNNMCGSYQAPVMANAPNYFSPATTAQVVKKEEKKKCWSAYLKDNPAMQQWVDANPSLAATKKAKHDDC